MLISAVISFLIVTIVGIFCWHPLSLALSVPPEEAVEVPILMYHGILKDKKLQGKYVIGPDLLESDLCYLKEHGYTAVVMQDLIDYTNGGDLPEKPIMITFDDGYYNNYLYAFPLMKDGVLSNWEIR